MCSVVCFDTCSIIFFQDFYFLQSSFSRSVQLPTGVPNIPSSTVKEMVLRGNDANEFCHSFIRALSESQVQSYGQNSSILFQESVRLCGCPNGASIPTGREYNYRSQSILDIQWLEDKSLHFLEILAQRTFILLYQRFQCLRQLKFLSLFL